MQQEIQKSMSCRRVSLSPSFRRVSVRNMGERNMLTTAPIFRTKTLRNDEARRYAMTNATEAFTLIELLVVVLIIGILAAVALPQYQKTVEKSKATQVMALLKSLGNAQESYRLANGEYATSFDELSVDVPWTGTNKWWNHSAIADTRSNNDWSLQILHDEDAGNKGIIAGKLSGQFAKKGGLIWLYQYDEDPSVPLNRPLCIENTSSITAGSYCTKILNATLVHTAGIRYFTLQY